MVINFASQLLLTVLLRVQTNALPGQVLFRGMLILRSWLVRLKDPAVSFELGGRNLRLPLSHDLPIILKKYPYYSHNLGRVVATLQQKYPKLTLIDIGANIGDSAAIIRKYSDCPILCIEGEARYFSLLQQNALQITGIAAERAFIGQQNEVKTRSIVSEKGTAAIGDGPGASEIGFQRLSQVLQGHPVFLASKIMKIDTDGYDLEIIRGSEDILRKSRPAVFFEYSPFHFEKVSEDGIAIFDYLEGLGYATALVWENVGEFLLKLNLHDKPLIADLHGFYSGRGGQKYADICVFHRDDTDVAERLRDSEVAYFRSLRTR